MHRPGHSRRAGSFKSFHSLDVLEILNRLQRREVGKVDPRHNSAGSFATGGRPRFAFPAPRSFATTSRTPSSMSAVKVRPSAAALRLARRSRSLGRRTVVRTFMCQEIQPVGDMSKARRLAEVPCASEILAASDQSYAPPALPDISLRPLQATGNCNASPIGDIARARLRLYLFPRKSALRSGKARGGGPPDGAQPRHAGRQIRPGQEPRSSSPASRRWCGCA